MNHRTGTTTAVRVRPATRKKFERIAKANRWSLVETADALADHFNETRQADKTQQQLTEQRLQTAPAA